MRIRTTLALAFLGTPLLAAAPPTTTIIQHARLIDGTLSPPRDHTTLTFAGDTITSITPDDAAPPPPAGATVIDATGKTLMPTLILCHAHLGLVQGTTSSPAHLTEENVRRQLHLYASYGIGTVVSLGLDHDFIFDLRQQLNDPSPQATPAQDPLPHLLTAGHGFTPPAGGPPKSFGDQLLRPSSPEEARTQVDELAKKHPDLIKIWLDDFGGSVKRLPVETYTAIIDQAHTHHLKVAAHVYYLADAKSIVNAGVDILAHSIRDLPVDDELIAAMKAHHTTLIPTLDMIEINFIYADHPAWMNDPFFTRAAEPGLLAFLASPKYAPQNRDRKILKLAQANLKKLSDANIPIAFGTDTGAAPIRVQGFGEHRELQLMVDAGLTPLQALHAATQTSATALGLPDTGTLAPHQKADLLLLDADPTTDIHNTQKISAIWLTGRPLPN